MFFAVLQIQNLGKLNWKGILHLGLISRFLLCRTLPALGDEDALPVQMVRAEPWELPWQGCDKHRPSGPEQSNTANKKYTFKVSKMQKVACFVAKESMKASLNISGTGASSLRRQHFYPKIKTSKVLLPGITSQCWQGPLFPRECYENVPSAPAAASALRAARARL